MPRSEHWRIAALAEFAELVGVGSTIAEGVRRTVSKEVVRSRTRNLGCTQWGVILSH